MLHFTVYTCLRIHSHSHIHTFRPVSISHTILGNLHMIVSYVHIYAQKDTHISYVHIYAQKDTHTHLMSIYTHKKTHTHLVSIYTHKKKHTHLMSMYTHKKTHTHLMSIYTHKKTHIHSYLQTRQGSLRHPPQCCRILRTICLFRLQRDTKASCLR